MGGSVRTWALLVACGSVLLSCDDDSASDEPASTTTGATETRGESTDTSGATTDPRTTSDGATTTTETEDAASTENDETAAPAEGWLEIGYGLDAFNPFEGDLPVTRGPQGALMFSLPLRGSDFPLPPDPFDFDHPDAPILTVWTDVDGLPAGHPSGRFVEYSNYPVPFSLSNDPEAQYEFVAVWLLIPDAYEAADLAGRQATVRAELSCSDGQFLVDEHVLTVVDATGER